MKAEG